MTDTLIGTAFEGMEQEENLRTKDLTEDEAVRVAQQWIDSHPLYKRTITGVSESSVQAYDTTGLYCITLVTDEGDGRSMWVSKEAGEVFISPDGADLLSGEEFYRVMYPSADGTVAIPSPGPVTADEAKQLVEEWVNAHPECPSNWMNGDFVVVRWIDWLSDKVIKINNKEYYTLDLFNDEWVVDVLVDKSTGEMFISYSFGSIDFLNPAMTLDEWYEVSISSADDWEDIQARIDNGTYGLQETQPDSDNNGELLTGDSYAITSGDTVYGRGPGFITVLEGQVTSINRDRTVNVRWDTAIDFGILDSQTRFPIITEHFNSYYINGDGNKMMILKVSGSYSANQLFRYANKAL